MKHRQSRTAWLALAAMTLQLALPLSAYAAARPEPPGFGDFCSTASASVGATFRTASASDESRGKSPAQHSDSHAPNHCAHCTVGSGITAILPSIPVFADTAAVQVAATADDSARAASARVLLPPPRGPPASFL